MARRLSRSEDEAQEVEMQVGNDEDVLHPGIPHEPRSAVAVLKEMMMEKKFLYSTLIFLPIAFVSHFGGWPEWIQFASSFIALIPLAGLLGDVTEQVAVHTNAVIGALLNASFGNATELIISAIAVSRGMNDFVQLTLLGSVLGNMLLVLGTAFFMAGLRRSELTYNPKATDAYGTLLVLSTATLAIPTAFSGLHDIHPDDVLHLSRVVSIIMLAFYMAYMFYSLKTHKHLFEDDGDDDEEAELPLAPAVVLLAVVTLLISACSEFLVDTVKPTAEEIGLPYMFIAVILVPIVGNVAEHAAAITLAMKGKMDVAIGIAVGSSIQIALFMIPFMVIVAWVANQPLSLNFHLFSIVLVVVASLLVKNVSTDGTTNWFEGILLVGMYVIVGVSYLYVPGEHIV